MAGNPATIRIVTELSGKGLDDAQAQLDKLRGKLGDTDGPLENTGLLHKKLGDLAGGAGTKINELASRFTSQLGPAGAQAQRAIESVTSKIGAMSVGSAAAVGGVAALAAALFAAGKSGVEEFLDLAEKTKAFKEAAGTSTEVSSILVDALDDLGIGADVGATAMARLAKNATINRDALADLGVQVAHTKDGAYDAWATLGNVAEAFASTDDQAKKAAIGNAAFGRSWAQLAPLLQGGRANLEDIKKEAERLGIVLNDADSAAAFRFKQSMVDLHDSLDGIKLAIGRGVVPEMANMASGASNLAEKFDGLTRGFIKVSDVSSAAFNGMTLGLGKVIGLFAKHKDGQAEAAKATDAASAAARGLVDITDEEGTTLDAATVAAAAHKEETKRASDAFKDYEQRTRDALKATEDMTAAQLAGAGVELGYEQATLNTSNALHDQTTKTADLDKAIQDHGATSEEARAAQAELEGQTIATKESFIRQADAAVNLAQNQAEANGQSLDAATKAQIQRGEYQNLADTLTPGSALRVYLEGLIQRLDAIPTYKSVTIDIEQNYHSSGQNNVGGVTVRAGGGPLAKGQPSIVGEDGPELFVPDVAGMVVPTDRTQQMLDQRSGVPLNSNDPNVTRYFVNLTVNSYGQGDRDFGLLVESALRRVQREKG